ncbi:MAG: hypothetical protein DDT34_02270 [Firmicutes bacterium]|nr:hypothetical protein [Bacillota bacterium]
MYLLRVQEVCIRSLDYQGMIVMSSKLSQLLMQHRHHCEVTKKVIQCLTLHNSKHVVPVYQSVIADWQ